MNLAIVSGNATRDPELRYTPKGTAVCNASIATNEKIKQQDGSYKDQVDFFDITLWGKTAENFAQYIRKGRKVLITGKLKTETWDDKQTGQKRTKIIIRGDTFEFMSSPKGEAGSDGVQPQAQAQQTRASSPRNQPEASSSNDEVQTTPINLTGPADSHPPEEEEVDVPF